ncbi:MAG: hypothetical protein ACXAD7_08845 [Candidatus Kariarchaeaceae archaeon]|jgi:hypothetical protein
MTKKTKTKKTTTKKTTTKKTKTKKTKRTKKLTGFVEELDKFLDQTKDLTKTTLFEKIFDIDKDSSVYCVAEGGGSQYNVVSSLKQIIESGFQFENSSVDFKSLITSPTSAEYPAIYRHKNGDRIRISIHPESYDWRAFETLSIFLSHLSDQRKFRVRQEILDIFLRLTKYNSGSIIPLSDLISYRFSTFESGDMSDELQWKEGIAALFYLMIRNKIDLPAPYLIKLEAFERTDELSEKLLN